jgi:hypothetical protein
MMDGYAEGDAVGAVEGTAVGMDGSEVGGAEGLDGIIVGRAVGATYGSNPMALILIRNNAGLALASFELARIENVFGESTNEDDPIGILEPNKYVEFVYLYQVMLNQLSSMIFGCAL